jgi:hypothetical protein
LTYEQLITKVDEVAPDLEGVAYKLLWRLIARAIISGRTDVEVSVRDLAKGLKTSKEGIARAIRELAQYIRVEARDGAGTTFFLPPDWFPQQRTLFNEDSLGGDFHNRPTYQDGSVLFTRTVASYSPGHQRPTHQDGTPTPPFQASYSPGRIVPLTRTQRPTHQDASHGEAREDTRARVRSIESEASASSEVVDRIDRAWGAVEIPVDREADAAVLSEWVYGYKCDLGRLGEHSTYPDTQMVARLLELAPMEEIQQVLRSLREQDKVPGDQDAWFFTVLAQRIHHVSPELVRIRMRAVKSKAPSHKRDASLFADQLLADAAAKVRRLG